jgi:hypothetical protein
MHRSTRESAGDAQPSVGFSDGWAAPAPCHGRCAAAALVESSVGARRACSDGHGTARHGTARHGTARHGTADHEPRGIPRGTVSRAARYPARHGIPRGTVS